MYGVNTENTSYTNNCLLISSHVVVDIGPRLFILQPFYVTPFSVHVWDNDDIPRCFVCMHYSTYGGPTEIGK